MQFGQIGWMRRKTSRLSNRKEASTPERPPEPVPGGDVGKNQSPDHSGAGPFRVLRRRLGDLGQWTIGGDAGCGPDKRGPTGVEPDWGGAFRCTGKRV